MTTLPEVDLDADLRVEVVAPDGSTAHAYLTGHGRRLRVEVDRPEVVGPEVGRRELGRAARMLSDAGLTVDLAGPRGPVATVGAGARSRLGTVLVGSDHVAMARGPDARRVLWTLVAPPLRRVVAAGGAVVLLGVLGVLGARVRSALRAPSRRP